MAAIFTLVNKDNVRIFCMLYRDYMKKSFKDFISNGYSLIELFICKNATSVIKTLSLCFEIINIFSYTVNDAIIDFNNECVNFISESHSSHLFDQPLIHNYFLEMNYALKIVHNH
ncbi:hypothetical protein DERP_003218 [Dermatophagoides pteronyssinus]|uniref:Uncharacterized protein n=1 Tax=Dermatophagoides pteronyssinus TaxID=6956 RepID=A0ABQ8JIV1_DERPT|nr:hypothetical protein DERP_003218 [Dermatophagoides pteronyssinus]